MPQGGAPSPCRPDAPTRAYHCMPPTSSVTGRSGSKWGQKTIVLHFFTDYVQIAAQDFSKAIEFSDVKRLNERLT